MSNQSEKSATTTDNGDVEGKILVRRQALAWAPEKPAVLETNAGEGHMYRLAWAPSAGRHLGIDKRFSRGAGAASGECWRGDNELLLARAMQAGHWDVVDIDTYANPWPLLRRLLHLTERPMTVVTTCAVERAMRANSSDFAFAAAGMNAPMAAAVYHTPAPFCRWYDDVVRWAMSWAERGSKLHAVEAKRMTRDQAGAGRGGAMTIHYYAIRYEVAKAC
jgi:hypothetical protein